MKAADFYDDFADEQVRGGINDRHRAIQQWLRKFGLAPGMHVLEVGCGVGTQTELIADILKGSGTLLALDLSPRSVELARKRLAGRPNLEIRTADVVELKLDRLFDVIVMPDVIEHIPLEQHPKLFANVRRWLKDTGWVLIHMPNPLYLEWCQQHRPDVLQVIDQPIFIETLLANTRQNGLDLHYLETYSIWILENDYQVVVLKPRPEDAQFHEGQPPRHSWRLTLSALLERVTRR